MARRVLLYSGGLDSFCLYYTNEFDVVLFIETGTHDNKQEMEVVKSMHIPNLAVHYLPIANYELQNKIIPFRNAMFVLIAAQYGSEIYLGATLGDTTKDKDYVFASQMEGMMNYFCLDSHKAPHDSYPFKIEMPFKGMTKTELLNSALITSGRDFFLQRLHLTRSCYIGDDVECGVCRSCLRKQVAFINHYIDLFPTFKTFNIQNLFTLLEESRDKRRHEKEIIEIKQAIQIASNDR